MNRTSMLATFVAAVIVAGAGQSLHAQAHVQAGAVAAKVRNDFNLDHSIDEHDAAGVTGTLSALLSIDGQRNDPNGVGVIGSGHGRASAIMTFTVDPVTGFLKSVSASGDTQASASIAFSSDVPVVLTETEFSLTIVLDQPMRYTATGTKVNGLGLKEGTPCNPFPDFGQDPCAGQTPAINSASGVLPADVYRVSGDVGALVPCCQGGNASDSFTFSLTLEPIHRPVLIIPGIGATYSSNVDDDFTWLMHRGVPPSQLQIDPMTRVYDDLIQTLKNAGYTDGKDLFIVNYDWRLPPGPDDGVPDGTIDGLTAQSISNGQYHYAVDYLGEKLKQAAVRWASDNPGVPLDSVDVISHSTGGLVARTYIQSGPGVYGGDYTPGSPLPRINNLIMIGVPNRGASKAWNPLQNNWSTDPAFQFVLSKIIDRAYEKVVNQGFVVAGPDYNISLDSLTAPDCLDLPEVCFINLYVPTARSLLATYNFLDRGFGPTNVNGIDGLQNGLLIDLNAGDSNTFAELTMAPPTIIFGTNGADTPTTVTEESGPTFTPLGFTHPIAEFEDVLGRDAESGEVYYEDHTVAGGGDGTVPLVSSRDQFLNDPRVVLAGFTKGGNTAGDVDHTALPYNIDVQRLILDTLDVQCPGGPCAISTGKNSIGLNSATACARGCSNFGLDPVEGFMVDGQGRRLGFSAATGPLTEIPGSVWFGNSEGMGWVFGPVDEPVTVNLSGLGQEYSVTASVLSSPTRIGSVKDQRFLAPGAQAVLPIPVADQTSSGGPIGDNLLPATTAASSPQANPAGWNASDVTTTLTAIDNAGGSGVRNITFSASGAQPIPATTLTGSSATITVAADGQTTLAFFATDNAGNAEPPKTITINLDKTAPAISASRTSLPNVNGWNNTDVVVSFQCSDTLSSLAAGSPPANRVVTGEGAGLATTGACQDVAGNSASLTVSAINIDRTPPAIVAPANQTVPQTSAAGATVTYPAPAIADGLSGVASSGCLPASGSVFAVGSTAVTCSATDRAGNSAAAGFTVVVTAIASGTPDGRMFGVGFIDGDHQHRHFAFRVSQLHSRDNGRLEYWANDPRFCGFDDVYVSGQEFDGDHDDNYGRDHHNPPSRFEATSIDNVVFSDDPAFQPSRGLRPPTVDTVRFSGIGKWNGRPGYTFEASATDQGEPGRRRDTFSLIVKDARGNIVASVNGDLDGGNIQSTRLPK